MSVISYFSKGTGSFTVALSSTGRSLLVGGYINKPE